MHIQDTWGFPTTPFYHTNDFLPWKTSFLMFAMRGKKCLCKSKSQRISSGNFASSVVWTWFPAVCEDKGSFHQRKTPTSANDFARLQSCLQHANSCFKSLHTNRMHRANLRQYDLHRSLDRKVVEVHYRNPIEPVKTSIQIQNCAREVSSTGTCTWYNPFTCTCRVPNFDANVESSSEGRNLTACLHYQTCSHVLWLRMNSTSGLTEAEAVVSLDRIVFYFFWAQFQSDEEYLREFWTKPYTIHSLWVATIRFRIVPSFIFLHVRKSSKTMIRTYYRSMLSIVSWLCPAFKSTTEVPENLRANCQKTLETLHEINRVRSWDRRTSVTTNASMPHGYNCAVTALWFGPCGPRLR